MKSFIRDFARLVGVFSLLSLTHSPAIQAAISPGQEQQRMEVSEKSQASSERLKAQEEQPPIEVGEQNVAVSDDVSSDAIDAGAAAPASAEEPESGPVSYLSQSSEDFKFVLKEIRVPEDAPISQYEMDTLISTFQGKEVKLSEVIYLTDNIAQLYASARLITKLNIIKEGFNEPDNQENESATTFVIDNIQVPDNAAISRDEVEALVKPYEGKVLTLNELRSFAKNLDKVYLSSENINAIAEGDYAPVSGGVIVAGRGNTSVASGRSARRSQKAADSSAPIEDVPFLIKKIEFSGNTVVSSAEIQKIVESFQDKLLKLSDAKQIALSITEHYRSKGYITCRAYIPPQKLSDGVLKIKIFEGKLGKIKAQGNKFFSNRVVKKYFNKLKGKVLQYRDLAKNATRANLHPDHQIKAVIIPGKSVGTSDLVLHVEDQYPLHIGGEINNFGTKLTGKERYSVSLRNTNLLGVEDIFAGRVQFGEEIFAIGTQYMVPVGEYDTQVGATYNYTDVGVGGDFSVLDLGGKAHAWSLFLNQPFYDGQYVDLTWTNAFESKSIENTILRTTSSKDELRMVRTGINMDETDPYGRTFITNDFTFGTPWLGASEKNDPFLSRRRSGASFFKYSNAINRIHPIRDYTYLMLKGGAQMTPDRLVSAEQFDIGGVYSVRGYPQSDYLGDYGASGSAEIRVPFYFIPRETKAPWSKEPLWNKLNFLAFIDAGHAALRAPAVGEFPSRNYWGAGGGVRFDLPKNMTGRFEYGVPFGDDPVDGSNGQFYFSVSGDLF